MKSLAAVSLGVSLLVAACTAHQDKPVPRPTAFPRVTDPGAEYVVVDSVPVQFEVNSAAELTRPRPDWLNIRYPQWNVTVHVSLTPVEPSEFESALDNRMQRLHLNIASLSVTDETEFETPDFSSVLLSSPDSRSTPLQFIAAGDSTMIISGVAFFENVTPDASVDSLAPIVKYIRRDLTHTLTNLSYR